MDASRDAVARFVGLEAYEQAGGGVRRDLFADEQNGIFLTDSALLDALARDKLAPLAEQVRAEGWAWVDAAPRATASDLYATLHAQTYGEAVDAMALVPHMLEAFMARDRGFRRGGPSSGMTSAK